MFKFANAYNVYNENGETVGKIEQKLSFGAKMLRLLLNPAMLPFHLDIVNTDGDVEASLQRGWTFWMSKVAIIDPSQQTIAIIRKKFTFLKPSFVIETTTGDVIAKITGNFTAWNFSITDATDAEIGTISKKWNGITKELFTTADKYIVDIVPTYTNNDANKLAIVATAITVDMVMKEKK
jgi:uncharacterized protein YxjI